MKIDVVIGSEECRFMLTAGTSEPRDAGNAAAGADGSGRGEGGRQSRGKKCAHCLKLQKDREPGQPTFKKCGQCRTTFYCGAQVRRCEFFVFLLLCCFPFYSIEHWQRVWVVLGDRVSRYCGQIWIGIVYPSFVSANCCRSTLST